MAYNIKLSVCFPLGAKICGSNETKNKSYTLERVKIRIIILKCAVDTNMNGFTLMIWHLDQKPINKTYLMLKS